MKAFDEFVKKWAPKHHRALFRAELCVLIAEARLETLKKVSAGMRTLFAADKGRSKRNVKH